jgi:hypothetical protein
LFYRSQVGKLYLDEARQEGVELGLKEIRERDAGVGYRQVLMALLRDRFGSQSDVEAIAERLAAGPDVAIAVRAVMSAVRLEDLADVQPSD